MSIEGKRIEELNEFDALNANENDFIPVVDAANGNELKKATVAKVKNQIFVMNLNILKKIILTMLQSIKNMTPQQFAVWVDSYLEDFEGLEFTPVNLIEKMFSAAEYTNINSINTGVKLLGAPIIVVPNDTENYEYEYDKTTITWNPTDFNDQMIMQNIVMTETQFKEIWAPAVMENWDTFADQFEGASWINLFSAFWSGLLQENKK